MQRTHPILQVRWVGGGLEIFLFGVLACLVRKRTRPCIRRCTFARAVGVSVCIIVAAKWKAVDTTQHVGKEWTKHIAQTPSTATRMAPIGEASFVGRPSAAAPASNRATGIRNQRSDVDPNSKWTLDDSPTTRSMDPCAPAALDPDADLDGNAYGLFPAVVRL